MTTSAYDVIRRITIDKLEKDGLDPLTDRDEITTAVAGAVDGYQQEVLGTADRPGLADPEGMVRRVVASIVAFGPLTGLLDARDVEEVFIEGDRVTFVDGRGRLRSLLDPVTAAEAMHMVARLLAPTDRRLDTSSPIVQARVLEGTARLTAVIPPVSDRLSATIRRYALRRDSLAHMVELGSLSEPAAAFLKAVMQTTSSILVSGPPGAGKTSLLAALLTAVPGDHCVRCIEEVRELSVNLSPNSSFYEARPPGVDGAASVTMRDLVKLVLAMRPDRIVVGEVRGAEAFELTRASNAGCGFCCTVHANSARDALEAIVNAALMAGENVAEPVVRKVFSSTIELVIHLDRDTRSTDDRGLRRATMEVLAVHPSMSDDFTTEPLFVRRTLDDPLEWTGVLPPAGFVARVEEAAGVSLRRICEGLDT